MLKKTYAQLLFFFFFFKHSLLYCLEKEASCSSFSHGKNPGIHLVDCHRVVETHQLAILIWSEVVWT